MVEAAVTREELLERARGLLPLVRERAEANERLRQVSSDVVDALVGSGLIRAAQPERFGGMGLDFDVTFELGMELSRACGSTGWCYAIWSSHNWLVGMFPLEAQEEYWADGPDTLSSTSFNPARGAVEAADGGYRVSGRWDFSSGCDPATWVMPIGNAPEGPALLMLPRADYRIDDNWFVVGLKGSGSKDIVVDEAFVPKHRAVSMEDVREGTTPGRKIHDTPNYRIPMRSILSYTLAASVLGMAKGGVEAFAENIQGQVSGRTGGKFTESVGLQLRLAEADAELRAAENSPKARLRGDLREGAGQRGVFAGGAGKVPAGPSLHCQAERPGHRPGVRGIGRAGAVRVPPAATVPPGRSRGGPPRIAGVGRSGGAVREGAAGTGTGTAGPLMGSRDGQHPVEGLRWRMIPPKPPG